MIFIIVRLRLISRCSAASHFALLGCVSFRVAPFASPRIAPFASPRIAPFASPRVAPFDAPRPV